VKKGTWRAESQPLQRYECQYNVVGAVENLIRNIKIQNVLYRLLQDVQRDGHNVHTARCTTALSTMEGESIITLVPEMVDTHSRREVLTKGGE